MTITTDTLSERKTIASTRISEIERKFGVALLDGDDVPDSLREEIEGQRRELIAVENAEGELVRRQREAAMAEQRERLLAVREKIAALQTRRLDAMARAHTAANHLMSAFLDAIESAEETRICFQHLGQTPPLNLDPTERLSWLLSGVLARVSGKPEKFGAITLKQMPNTHDWRVAHERDWEEFDRKQSVAAVLAAITSTEGTK